MRSTFDVLLVWCVFTGFVVIVVPVAILCWAVDFVDRAGRRALRAIWGKGGR